MLIDMIPGIPEVSPLLAFILPGHSEWIILLVLGLLIFGRRLPEVGRSLGRSIVEFKRGIKGIDDEIEEESSKSGAKQIADASQRESLPEGAAAATGTTAKVATSENAKDQ